jgi:hypothetical protein
MTSWRAKRLVLAAVAVLVLAAAGSGGLWWRGSRVTAADPGARPAPVATTTVTRTDLTTNVTASGQLGYGSGRVIKGQSEGKVTWLPAVGTLVARGGQLARIDDKPVTLMYGSTPMFRSLDTVGMLGRDVKVLVDNLRALGYPTGRQPAVGAVIPQAASAPPS